MNTLNIIMFMKYFHLSYRSLHWGQELPEKEGGWSQKTLSQRSEIGQKTIIKRYLNVNGIWNRAHIDIWTRAKHNYWKVSEIEQNTIILIWQIYWKEPEEIWRRTATKLHEFDKCIERNKVKHVLKGTRLTSKCNAKDCIEWSQIKSFQRNQFGHMSITVNVWCVIGVNIVWLFWDIISNY